MKRRNILPVLSITILAASLFAVGCQKTLAPGGAYNQYQTNATTGAVSSVPDKAFYASDSAFWAAYSALDTIFNIERDNRDLLWSVSPDIKHSLDSIRPTASQVLQGYLKARAKYIQTPTPEGLTGIEAILAELQRVVSAAQVALPSNMALPGVSTNNPALK